MTPTSPLLPFEQALKEIEQACQRRVGVEQQPVSQCLNRILVSDLIAPLNLPPADNSAMDGYALNTQDWRADRCFPVSQRIPAGRTGSPLTSGTCARIFTGAEVPAGADTVVMQENAIVDEGGVLFPESPISRDNIRPAGQDVRQGERVLPAGTRLSPAQMGMAASLGYETLPVFQSLKVGILTTGDELVAPGNALQSGQIYNSNGPMLAALTTQLGFEVSAVRHVKDDPVMTATVLQELAEKCDFILSSGGVSVGEEDHVKAVIEDNGHLMLWKVAVKPGKPLAFGEVFGTPYMGLPGNPSSSLVTFHWFARIALLSSAGATVKRPLGFPVQPDFERHRAIGRDEFLRVYLSDSGKARLHPQQSSGALSAACLADGYLHIPAQETIGKQQFFTFYPFSSF